MSTPCGIFCFPISSNISLKNRYFLLAVYTQHCNEIMSFF